MLKITHDSKRIEVRFFHQEHESDWIEAHTGICVDENRRCSMAIVSIQNTVGELGNHSETEGISVCNPIDNFCRATGRKRALRHALHSLSKEIRCAIWGEYEVQMGF
jgi:hypothetical protein